MKVCVYLHSYPPFRYTGGELMTADLLEYLVQRGHTVDVFVKEVEDTYVRNGVTVTTSGYLHPTFIRLHDIFITHPEIRTGAIRQTGTMPYVGIVHNTGIHTMRSIERQAPDLTICNSQHTQSRLPKTVQASRMGSVVINPPVLLQPLDGVQEGRRAASHSLPARHYVTMVNISHEKGGAVLAYLAERNPDVAFLGVIGGHGSQVEDQPDNVTILGPQEDMRPVYDATKTLIFPTKREAYGKVAAEAMQWGIPCIVSDLPALHEVCGDAAVFVDPHNYAAWDVALQTMQFDVHDRYAALSLQRGKELHANSLNDLARFEAALLDLAGQ